MKRRIINFFSSKATILVAFIMALTLPMILQSCDWNDDKDYYIGWDDDVNGVLPNAIVTVKTAADKTIYLQLDDSTTLLPTNMKEHPFNGKEVRAFVRMRNVGDNAAPFTRAVVVNSIDSVLTKPAVATLGDKNNEVYGKDPVEIYKGFPTVCEDNYLTIGLGTVWGANAKPHFVNLVTGVNPDDPYEVELRQNAYGDTKGRFAYTTVAFSLKSLPSTGGKKVKLKVRYQSFEGEKTVEFDYKTK